MNEETAQDLKSAYEDAKSIYGEKVTSEKVAKTILLKRKEKKAARDLKDLKEILDKKNIHFWLMSGTLLGFVKRKGILPGDRDVDIACRMEKRKKFLSAISDLKEKGFDVTRRYDPVFEKEKGMITVERGPFPIDIKFLKSVDNYLVRSIHKRESDISSILWILIDILWFEDRLNKESKNRRNLQKLSRLLPEPTKKTLIKLLSYIWRKSSVKYGIVAFKRSLLDKFKKVEIYGINVHIPSKTKKYIQAEYGDEWRNHKPSGGGWSKPSHIVYSEMDKKDLKHDIKKVIERLEGENEISRNK